MSIHVRLAASDKPILLCGAVRRFKSHWAFVFISLELLLLLVLIFRVFVIMIVFQLLEIAECV